MPRHPAKADFPVANIRRYLEPGPVVLVTSAWRGKTISRRGMFRPEYL